MGEAAVFNRALFYVIWFLLAGVLTVAQPGFGVAALVLGLIVRGRVR